MNYQDLTVKDLDAELKRRDIPRRSRARTKDLKIELLEADDLVRGAIVPSEESLETEKEIDPSEESPDRDEAAKIEDLEGEGKAIDAILESLRRHPDPQMSEAQTQEVRMKLEKRASEIREAIDNFTGTPPQKMIEELEKCDERDSSKSHLPSDEAMIHDGLLIPDPDPEIQAWQDYARYCNQPQFDELNPPPINWEEFKRDRLSANEAQTLENSLPNLPAGKNFTGTPPKPIAPPTFPEPEPESDDTATYKERLVNLREPRSIDDAKIEDLEGEGKAIDAILESLRRHPDPQMSEAQTQEVRMKLEKRASEIREAIDNFTDFNHNADSFRVTPAQLQIKLNDLVQTEISQNRPGEFIRFLPDVEALSHPCDRSLAKYLDSQSKALEFVGKCKALDYPPNLSIFGWRFYENSIQYGRLPNVFCWRFHLNYGKSYREQFKKDFRKIIGDLLRNYLGDKFFSPVLDGGTISHYDWQKSEWIFGGLNGYWYVRDFPDLGQVETFRWWWTEKAGWRLDFQSIRSEDEMRCSCKAWELHNNCGHLKAIVAWRQREQRRIQREADKKEQQQHEESIKLIEQKRQELADWLRDSHFQKAGDIGCELYRQPFWGLSLECLESIKKRVLESN